MVAMRLPTLEEFYQVIAIIALMIPAVMAIKAKLDQRLGRVSWRTVHRGVRDLREKMRTPVDFAPDLVIGVGRGGGVVYLTTIKCSSSLPISSQATQCRLPLNVSKREASTSRRQPAFSGTLRRCTNLTTTSAKGTVGNDTLGSDEVMHVLAGDGALRPVPGDRA